MPKLPRNVRRRGKRYEYRARANGRNIIRDLGEDPQEMRRLARLAEEEMRGLRAKPCPRTKRRQAESTVAQFGEQEWLPRYIKRKRNSKGQQIAKSRFQTYIVPCIGHMALTEVTLGDLEVLDASLKEATLTPQTVRHVMSDVRCMFLYAVARSALDRSPFVSKLLLDELPETIPRALTEEQVEDVLRVAGPYEFPVRLALLTGLRWGEIHSLTWDHVTELPEPRLVLERTKSNKVRRVPLNQEAWEMLMEVRRHASSPLVYAPRFKNPRQINDWISRRVGFHFSFHMLRHTFATRWVERRGSLGALQAILGHSTPIMTQRYTHLNDDVVSAEHRRVMGD